MDLRLQVLLIINFPPVMCNTKVFIAYRDGLTVVGNYSLVVAKTRKALNCQKLRVENDDAWDLLH